MAGWKFPGTPLWAGWGTALSGSEAGPPWLVRQGRWLVTEVAYRLEGAVWEVGDRVRFGEFGQGGAYVLAGRAVR